MTFPSGTVTFLFTDIEGSTQLWEKHPEAMKPALAAHDEILKEAFEINLRERSNSPMTDFERGEYDQMVAQVRSLMDETKFKR